jgi:hypothetical protein
MIGWFQARRGDGTPVDEEQNRMREDQGVDELLEAFESEWDRGEPPDVFAFADRSPGEDLPQAVSELIQIDLERRWRDGNPRLRLDLSHYLDVLPNVFGHGDLLELVCWEYRIRNQWGDCVSRTKVVEEHGHLGDDLLSSIERTAQDMSWPLVTVTVNGRTVIEMPLDRDIVAGRQSDSSQEPWSVTTTPLCHQVVFCESRDATLSRKQLAVSLHTPNAVLLRNRSTNRALAVQGLGAIDSRQTLTCNIPVVLHLGASRYLRICKSTGPVHCSE